MAAGVPVIASDLPSVREILTDGNEGRLVRPERPAELARAVRILLEYPERREEMGRNARLKIERSFTWTRATETLSMFYDSLLPEQSRASVQEEPGKAMVL
jgi:glycosyltransferase involved in cell wall biosynthesis